MSLKAMLRSIGACKDAVRWAGGRDLETAWAECKRGDWMLWLCGKMQGKEGWPTRQQIVLVACDCAELSLPIFENKYPIDKRPRVAIETARKWAVGEASIDDVRSAADAADAYAAAYAAAAADAAYAAAYAAAAADIADIAATAAARTTRLRECADICRGKLFIPGKVHA